MEPPVNGQRRKGKYLRIGRRNRLHIKDVDGLRLRRRRTDHWHHFVVAGEQRCRDGSQQFPVVHGTQRLRTAVDPRDRDHRSGNLRTAQHPGQELRRQQGHIERQKHVERPAARRERRLDPAERSASRMQISNGAGASERAPAILGETGKGRARSLSSAISSMIAHPAGAMLYPAPCASCGLRQAQNLLPRRNPHPSEEDTRLRSPHRQQKFPTKPEGRKMQTARTNAGADEC